MNIAYRVMGDGPVDVVWVPGLFSNADRGMHQLKGVPGDWQLFTVTSA